MEESIDMRGLLRHTAEVQALDASGKTVAGTYAPSYSTRIASLSCLVQQKTLQEPIEFRKKTVRVVHRLYCMESDGSAISESDRIIWNSKTLEIVGIKDGGGQGNHLEIDCLEVR